MKKIYKKIILVALIIAVLGVSVYAWAYINNKVDIGGMQVKPSGTEGLYISKSENGSFSATITASTTSARTLNAVSTADLKNWYIPANAGSITESGEYNSDFITIDSGDASDYYYSESFYVKSTEGLSALKITGITVKNSDGSDPEKEISKSLRVGIKNSSNTVYIFAPVEGYDELCQVVGAGGSLIDQNIKSDNGTSVISGMLANEANKITVYVWYEGQDGNYTIDNLYDPEDLVISIEFTGISN